MAIVHPQIHILSTPEYYMYSAPNIPQMAIHYTPRYTSVDDVVHLTPQANPLMDLNQNVIKGRQNTQRGR